MSGGPEEAARRQRGETCNNNMPIVNIPSCWKAGVQRGRYKILGERIGALVDEKQSAYGDSFGKSAKIMRILYPDGIPVTQIDNVLFIVRVLDKLSRIATNNDPFGENPAEDIAGYGLLETARRQEVCNGK